MEDVPLCQEIDAIDAYLSIEATRFGERLEIDIDVSPDAVDAPCRASSSSRSSRMRSSTACRW
jgi:hypothetical protein